MATNQTIATTLTADSRPAVQSLRTFDAEVGKAFTRLDAMNKRAFASGGGGILGGGPGGRGGGNFAAGFQELARGVEDFSAAFQTGGLQGGLRGASNNLSQMAMVMGGPLAGAIAGLTVAALPSLVKWLDSSGEATRKLKEENESAIKSINELFESRAAANIRGVEFGSDLAGIGDSGGALSALRQRQREARVLEEREFFNRQQRDEVAGRGGNGQFSKEIEEELRRLDTERLGIQEKQLQTQHEITRLKERQKQLQKDEAAAEFADRIRKFQEEDAKQAEQDAERRIKREQREFESLENILQSRIGGLGGKVDPLDDLGLVGPGMDEARKLLGEIDALKDKKPGQLAGVATADSQSLLRAQQVAKDAAEAKRQRAELLKKLEDLIREVKNNRPPDIEDDVNLT